MFAPLHKRGGSGARPRCRRGVWLNASARPRNVSGRRLPPAFYDSLWREHKKQHSNEKCDNNNSATLDDNDRRPHALPSQHHDRPNRSPLLGTYTDSAPELRVLPLLLAGKDLRAGLQHGCDFSSVLDGVEKVLKVVPGSLGLFMRSTHLALRPRALQTSSRDIFPIPWFTTRLARSGRARERSRRPLQRLAVRLANVWLAVLNYLHWGPAFGVEHLQPTAAQSRVRLSLLRRARDFLRRCPFEGAGGEALYSMLKVADDGYGAKAEVLPLGMRAGVPESAAQVNASEVLQDLDPELAEQCEEPSALLLPLDRWPDSIPQGFKRLDRTYATLVDKAVNVGLMELASASEVLHLGGVVAEQSAFAVPKDAHEDRWISAMEVTNKLVDVARLRRIHLPYMPQLATVSTQHGRKLVLTKRDARHYFHMLRNGIKWRKYMSQPAVRKHGLKRYPLLRSWPMGFRNSAIIAHRITDVVANKADLPSESRFVPNEPTPLQPPIWATCLDDFVALHYEEDVSAIAWGQRLDAAWKAIGVSSHEGKALDGQPNREMLGFQVGADDHHVSLTPDKEWSLMQMLIFVAMRWQYPIACLQRVVGKANFVHGLRPSMRSIFWKVYRVATEAQNMKIKRVGASFDVMLELIFAAMLLPLSRLSLQAPWCDRVVAHDAAPGGHGLAYATLPKGDAQHWARWACHRGEYTILEDCDRWLRIPKTGATPLHTVDLPLQRLYWHEVSKPGSYNHICLEESDAFVWALTERLHRIDELGHRCVHLGDNSAQVFAKAKGRSSNFLMNVRCRRVLALELLGDIVTFILYVPSSQNPSDRASRKYATHLKRSGGRIRNDVLEVAEATNLLHRDV